MTNINQMAPNQLRWFRICMIDFAVVKGNQATKTDPVFQLAELMGTKQKNFKQCKMSSKQTEKCRENKRENTSNKKYTPIL